MRASLRSVALLVVTLLAWVAVPMSPGPEPAPVAGADPGGIPPVLATPAALPGVDNHCQDGTCG